MKLDDLVEKGYFPSELPPPFHTEMLAKKLSKIEMAWNAIVSNASGDPNARKLLKQRFCESRWTRYSYAKYGYVRRSLALPNPFHQVKLARSIVDNWSDIETVLNRSSISSSKPVIGPFSRRALERKNTYSRFLEECLLVSYDSKYEVVTDISRFYPSLYTHAIPWAVHSIPVAKANARDFTYFGNVLDRDVREGNSRQTFGIPIGPDTSLVLAELVLCTLDEEIERFAKSAKVRVLRHIDDYRIYAKSRGDAEKILRQIQQLLNKYELFINETKTSVSEAPNAYVEDWVTAVRSFDFSIDKSSRIRGQISKQRNVLKDFVSTVLRYSKKHPDKWVVSYSFPYLTNIELYDENWDLYIALMFKLALVEPQVLPELARVLVDRAAYVNKPQLRDFIATILIEHVPRGNHSEVSWALWLCKEFNLTLNSQLAEMIFESSDVISIMIALDLRANGLVSSKVSTHEIEKEMTTESLMDENWLLTYEAMCKGWVKVPRKNPVNQNEYFKILKRHKVSFYDDKRRLVRRSVRVPGFAGSSPLVTGSSTGY